MKTEEKLKIFAEQIKRNELNPAGLSEIAVKLASHYSYMASQYIRARLHYAEFYMEHKKKDDKGKLLSDKFVENLYLTTKEGQEWYQLKRGLRSIEKMLSIIKGAVYTANQERINSNI